MSAETQVNALKSDLAEAVKEAHASLDKAVEKLDVYLTKLQEENTPVAPVESTPASPVQSIPVTTSPEPVTPTPATDNSPATPPPSTGETFTPDVKPSK